MSQTMPSAATLEEFTRPPSLLGRSASGRYITSGHNTSFAEFGEILRDHFGDAYPLPSKTMPKWLVWLMGPMVDKSLSRRMVTRNVGHLMTNGAVLDKDGNEVSGLHAVWIMLDNPDQLNSYTTPMVKDTILAFRKAANARDVVGSTMKGAMTVVAFGGLVGLAVTALRWRRVSLWRDDR